MFPAWHGHLDAKWAPARARLWASIHSLAPCSVLFKVIRVPAGVETGTDVPARGNGLIFMQAIPTRAPTPRRRKKYPVGTFLYVTRMGDRAESRRMTCGIIHP